MAKCSQSTSASGLCGKFGNRLFTAIVVRARRKNAGIAGPTSNFFNAAMATVAKKSVTEFPNGPLEAAIDLCSASVIHNRIDALP